MYDFEKKIEEYFEALFAELGPVALPEERKADIYARLEEHMRLVIEETFQPVIHGKEMEKIKEALQQEDYRALRKILRRYPQYADILEQKLEKEFTYLKSIIAKEQQDGRDKTAS